MLVISVPCWSVLQDVSDIFPGYHELVAREEWLLHLVFWGLCLILSRSPCPLYGHLAPTAGPHMSSGISVSLYPPTGVCGNFWIPYVPTVGFGEPGPLNTTLARLAYLARAPRSWDFSTNAGFWREGKVGIEVLLPCSRESSGQAHCPGEV